MSYAADTENQSAVCPTSSFLRYLASLSPPSLTIHRKADGYVFLYFDGRKGLLAVCLHLIVVSRAFQQREKKIQKAKGNNLPKRQTTAIFPSQKAQ